MRKIDISDFKYSVKDIMLDCSTLLSDNNSKAVKNCTELAELACAEYIQHIPLDFVNYPKHSAGTNNDDVLRYTYDKVFVGKKSKLKTNYYELIKKLANGSCLFCDREPPRTLDHFLPKADYPLLSVAPINLIPCCRDCNDNKHTYVPDANTNIIIHPYFDVINEVWLKVVLHFGHKDEVASSISVLPLTDKVLQSRLEATIEKLQLNEGFECGIRGDILTLRKKYYDTYKQMGIDALKETILIDLESSEDYDVNSYKSAMFRALYDQIMDFEKWLNLY